MRVLRGKNGAADAVVARGMIKPGARRKRERERVRDIYTHLAVLRGARASGYLAIRALTPARMHVQPWNA